MDGYNKRQSYRDQGASLLESSFLAFLMALAVISAVKLIGNSINSEFQTYAQLLGGGSSTTMSTDESTQRKPGARAGHSGQPAGGQAPNSSPNEVAGTVPGLD